MTLKQIQDDLVELIRIEGLIKLSRMTENDVLSLHRLAKKGAPRAQFYYAAYMLLVERNEAEGYLWLNRCKQRCNALFLWKIRMLIRIWKSEKNSYHNVH
jgi:hypothetical protein